MLKCSVLYVKSRVDDGENEKDVLSCRQSVARKPSECAGSIVSVVGRSKLALTVDSRERKPSTMRVVGDGC